MRPICDWPAWACACNYRCAGRTQVLRLLLVERNPPRSVERLHSSDGEVSWNDRFLYRGIRQAKSYLLHFALHLRLGRRWQITSQGLALLFEVGTLPPHDGFRRMWWFNLWSALADDFPTTSPGALALPWCVARSTIQVLCGSASTDIGSSQSCLNPPPRRRLRCWQCACARRSVAFVIGQ
jgi:hypothetical protein